MKVDVMVASMAVTLVAWMVAKSVVETAACWVANLVVMKVDLAEN